MTFETFFKELLKDIKTELADEFDRNFERKAFFDEPWAASKRNAKGSLMMRTGALRRSIQAKIEGMSIHFSSSLPYASVHNEGGEITVTAGMKKFFWAMYYKASGGISKRKDGTAGKTKKNAALTIEAQYWKSLALMKTGSKIKMPERRFIGHHPKVDAAIEQIAEEHAKDLEQYINSLFKHNKK